MTRDLVNIPANDMGPDTLEGAVRDLAQKHGANVTSIIGDQLLRQNFPMIHAVGRASDIAPRLVDLQWGAKSAKKVTLVGDMLELLCRKYRVVTMREHCDFAGAWIK